MRVALPNCRRQPRRRLTWRMRNVG